MDEGPFMIPNPIYLGDAVYAYFDGHGMELRLNDHRNECAVYLEPEVIGTLIHFWGSAITTNFEQTAGHLQALVGDKVSGGRFEGFDLDKLKRIHAVVTLLAAYTGPEFAQQLEREIERRKEQANG
jgi:hypothetical protein